MSIDPIEQVRDYRSIEQLIPSHWQQMFVSANDIRQYVYRTGGHKPPLVLFHGFMESGLSWLRFAKAMEDRYDVIMPDARIHGRSDRPQAPLTPELLAEDALALIHSLDLRNPILFGRSNGAVTAVLAAAAQPNLTRAVLLEDPPMGGMPRPNVRSEASGSGNWFDAWLQWMRNLGERPHAERVAAAAERWPHGTPVVAGEPIWPEEEFVPWVEGLAQFDISVFKRKIDYWALTPYLKQVASISCPILLLAGNPEHGSLVPDEAEAELEATWQQGTTVRFENAGHLISRGRTFASALAAIESFLAQV